MVKKKVKISAADNINPDPDVALELGKSIYLTEVTEEEAARQVHATHERIVIESVLELARRRPACVVFRDTSRVSKKVSSDPSQKLKGVQSITLEEQEATNTALKERQRLLGSNLTRQKEKFKEYAYYDTESLKKTILSYLNSIEIRIDERACHEEELQKKEQNVKERRNDVKWLNEMEFQKQEKRMNVGTILDDNLDVTKQQGKSSSPGNERGANGAKISKNGLDNDITIAKFSHDKDKTEVQWSNNRLLENYHEVKKTNENNKALKEANDLLTKELKTYKEKVRVLEISKGNNTTYFNEYIKADRKAKRFEKESQSQSIRDRYIIRDLKQERDKLQLSVTKLKRQSLEHQKTQTIFKLQLSD
uniref:Uncharacterized protein n=1 Tax=Tanacetum cinerariifolium TaxID=118510 RepID=A0A6L2LAK0_TANCI|nr:hypothetical protein [Tanacetum cinerariifolium]